MRPVQPERDQPLIEQFLQLGHRPQRLVLDMTAAPVRAAPGIAGRELAEQRGHRPEVPFDAAFLRAAAQMGGLDGNAQVPAGARNAAETNTLPWSITIVSGTITGLAAACSSRASMSSSRSYGSTECAILSASGQPGRTGSA